ncbi:MAG: thrombospondin type 3 repeat-containing protein [Pseudomonadota bacterium]|nr:thrombospondin type 3 repeat-containing protein [Pseudomonadota bacterium]
MLHRLLAPLLISLALGLVGAGQAHAGSPPTISLTGTVEALCDDGSSTYPDTLPFGLHFTTISGYANYYYDNLHITEGSAYYHLYVGVESNLSRYYGAGVVRTNYYQAGLTDQLDLSAGTTFGGVTASVIRTGAELLEESGPYGESRILAGDVDLSAFAANLANVENAAGDLCTVSALGTDPTTDLQVTIYDASGDSDGDGVNESADQCPTVDASGYDAGNGDGCVDDYDADGITDLLDSCPRSSNAVDLDGNGIPDGCDAGDFATGGVSLTIAGTVTAECYTPDSGIYVETYDVAFEATYDDASEYVMYNASVWEDTYAGGTYFYQSVLWANTWSVTFGDETLDLDGVSTPYYAGWYHAFDEYSEQYYGNGSQVGGYFYAPSDSGWILSGSVGFAGTDLFADVRDHLDPASLQLASVQLSGSNYKDNGDYCRFSVNGAGEGFTLVVTSLEPDADNDGVSDDEDLCPGFDDTITGDTDHDGFCDALDNCADDYNPTQVDADGDGLGNACEGDTDGDGTVDDYDNCEVDFNTDQADSDFDDYGDVCDADDDNDGRADISDNCPLLPNASQADQDRDGSGDACDGDDDADGVSDATDVCPGTPMDVSYDAGGCSGVQRVEVTCGDPCDYRNHGQYVSCVTQASNDVKKAGLIGNTEKANLTREAARNTCR